MYTPRDRRRASSILEKKNSIRGHKRTQCSFKLLVVIRLLCSDSSGGRIRCKFYVVQDPQIQHTKCPPSPPLFYLVQVGSCGMDLENRKTNLPHKGMGESMWYISSEPIAIGPRCHTLEHACCGASTCNALKQMYV